MVNKRGWVKYANVDTGMFQGFTGTMDTLLHLHVAYFCIKEGKRVGIIQPEESAIAMAMIDDRVICLPFSASRSPSEKAETARAFYNHIIRIYKLLGLTIDRDKTIVSTQNFVFLNIFFSRSHEVLTAVKVYSKLDREHQKTFGGTVLQCRTIAENARNASSRGCDPIVAYTLAICLSNRLMFLTYPPLSTRTSTALCGCLYLPAGMGGGGYPNLSQMMCSECPDNLTAYLGLMKNIIHLLCTDVAKEELISVIVAACARPFAIPNCETFLATPTTVRYSDITEPADVAQATIHDMLKKRAKSRIFADLLNIKGSSAYNDAVWDAVRLCEADSSILCAVGSVLPGALINTVIDRVRKNELIVNLLSYNKRKKLLRKHRRLDREHIRFIADLPLCVPSAENVTMFKESSAMRFAYDLRMKYYEFLNVVVHNHIIPDPMTCTCRVLEPDGALFSLHFKAPKPIGDELYTNSLYDSSAKLTRVVHGRSRGAVINDPALGRCKNQCDRSMIEAAAVCSYVMATGRNASALWDFVKALYGSFSDQFYPTTYWTYDSSASSKRIGYLKVRRSHYACVYPNCLACVEITAPRLEQIFESAHTSTDYMNYIVSHRATLLDSTPISTSASFYISEEKMGQFNSLLERISGYTNVTIHELFLAAMKNMVVSSDGTKRTGMLATTFGVGIPPKEVGGRLVSAVSIRPAIKMRPKIFHPEIYESDENKFMYSEIRNHAQRLGNRGAIISAVAQVVFNSFNHKYTSILLEGRWRDCILAAEENLKAPVDIYNRIYDALDDTHKRYLNDSYSEQGIGTNIAGKYYRALSFGVQDNDDEKKYAVGAYLYMALGKYPSILLYPLTAQIGASAISRVHSFAASRYLKRAKAGTAESNEYMLLRSMLYKMSATTIKNTGSFSGMCDNVWETIKKYIYASRIGVPKLIDFPEMSRDIQNVPDDFIEIMKTHHDTLIYQVMHYRRTKIGEL
ncbi:hypothetical protein GJ496_002290 [Pomphorhynchus laevis]|nr:hypothetical protein GJ496_002290 [Pomphorhynchus laevis]